MGIEEEIKMQEILAEQNKKTRIQNMTTKELAEWLHNAYEDIAIKNNWKTQIKCRVEFNKLPEQNKRTMLSLARKIHKFV